MEVSVNTNRRRRRQRPGEIRLLEKQMRPEVIERCLQFVDVIINQIIYQENIYPSDLFKPRQMYNQLVYQSIDKQISSYITLCVASLRDLFSQQLSDMISINIIQNCRIPLILRRYLFEFHITHDPCLRAIYDNTKQLINQLDQAFAQSIQTIQQIKPLENNQHFNKGWTFQLRSCPDGKNSKGLTIGEILRKNPFYKEFVLINQQSNLLSSGKESIISSIKSLHTERLKLQFMCEDDKYEQNKFHLSSQDSLDITLTDQQDTDTDSDIDDLNENSDDTNISLFTRKKSNDGELWPLTTVNNLPLCTIDEEEDIEEKSNDNKQEKKKKRRMNIDSDSLVDRYNLTQKLNRNNFDDHLQYSSDEELQQIRSPYSPDTNWQDEDDDQQDEEVL